MSRCSAITLSGKRCKKNATCNGVCWIHGPKEMNECGICLSESVKYTNRNVNLDCGHIFCSECIYKWTLERGIYSSCPMCRVKIEDRIIFLGQRWALQNGLLRRVETVCYPLNRLEEFDAMYMSAFCDFMSSTALRDSDFQILEQRIKQNQDNNYIFEKLKELSYINYSLIRSDTPNMPERIHVFVM
jgi:hypothetical protein